eukprot:scaffold51698_cov31-Tisochrysis_lutea.AAC.1
MCCANFLKKVVDHQEWTTRSSYEILHRVLTQPMRADAHDVSRVVSWVVHNCHRSLLLSHSIDHAEVIVARAASGLAAKSGRTEDINPHRHAHASERWAEGRRARWRDGSGARAGDRSHRRSPQVIGKRKTVSNANAGVATSNPVARVR